MLIRPQLGSKLRKNLKILKCWSRPELSHETDQESGGVVPVDVVHVGVARRSQTEEADGRSALEVLFFRRQTRGNGFEALLLLLFRILVNFLVTASHIGALMVPQSGYTMLKAAHLPNKGIKARWAMLYWSEWLLVEQEDLSLFPTLWLGWGKTENLLIYNCSVSATLIERTSVDQYWSKVCGVIF